MRFVFVADPHIGNHRKFGGQMVRGCNERAHAIAAALQEARSLAVGADYFVILGDLFDTDRPSPALVELASRALRSGGSIGNSVHNLVLVGNHDRTSYEHHSGTGEHSILSMRSVQAVPGITLIAGALMVPALPRSSESFVHRIREYCLDAGVLAHDTSVLGTTRARVLCVHAGVMDDSTPQFLRSTSAMDMNELFDLMDEFDIELTVCGDWHEHKMHVRGDRQIVQVGALVPTGFDNLGHRYGHVVGYDTHTKQLADYVVRGPRFLKVVYEEQTLDAAWVQSVMTGSKDVLYVKVSALPENMKHARSDLEQMVSDEFIRGYDLVPSKEMVRVQAKAAATRASSAATFETALEEYLRVTPLPEGATRKGVIDKVSALLTHKRT